MRIELGECVHVLRGADGYWVDGTRFGVTFEDAAPRFGGALYAAYEWGGADAARALGPVPPPDGARVLRGVELPDALWAEVSA